jgi:hypothetical protein
MTGAAASPPSPPAGDAKRSLSRELSEFLIELSIALHKHAMYPDGHPSLAPAAAGVVRRATPLLEDRGSLSLGVARNQLVIEGVATDPRHPVLAELAGRLHRHHLGAVTFYRDVESEEVANLLRTLAVEADRTGQPLGLGPREQLTTWRHARLHPLTYERLELLSDEPAPVEGAGDDDLESAGGRRVRGAQLWIGLARAALAGAIADDEPPPMQPAVIAKAIDEHPKAEGYDQVIVGYLLQIAEELRAAGGEGAVELRRRTSRLVKELKPETLQRLIEMGGDAAQRKRFVLDAADGMAVDAVVEILRAAAEAGQQTISHSLVRMLNKLAAHAEGGLPPARPIADEGLRDQVKRLLAGWELDDPNPGAYGAALQRIAQSAPLFQAPSEQAHGAEEERLVHMALEVGAVGPIVWRAVDGLVDRGRVADVLDLIDRAQQSGTPKDVCAALRAHVATPARLSGVLGVEPVDWGLADRVLGLIGTAGAEPLLDLLAASAARGVRRAALERLTAMGPAIAPAVLARLEDERWYVVRNLLTIIDSWPQLPDGFSAAPYAVHPDARVRRSSVKLQLRLPDERERGIAAALADPDPHLVELGLIAAQRAPSDALLPQVVRYARDRTLPSEVRVAAIRALARSRSVAARETLLGLTEGGRTLLGKPKLPSTTPELLAALRGLAVGWGRDPRAAEVLARAAVANDPEVRAATDPGTAT